MDIVKEQSNSEEESYKLSGDDTEPKQAPTIQDKFDQTIFARMQYHHPGNLWRIIHQYQLYG